MNGKSHKKMIKVSNSMQILKKVSNSMQIGLKLYASSGFKNGIHS
jgi:hypothetical protein